MPARTDSFRVSKRRIPTNTPGKNVVSGAFTLRAFRSWCCLAVPTPCRKQASRQGKSRDWLDYCEGACKSSTKWLPLIRGKPPAKSPRHHATALLISPQTRAGTIRPLGDTAMGVGSTEGAPCNTSPQDGHRNNLEAIGLPVCNVWSQYVAIRPCCMLPCGNTRISFCHPRLA